MRGGDDAFDIIGGGAAAIVAFVALIVFAFYAFLVVAGVFILVALLKPCFARWAARRRHRNSVFYY